MVLVSISLNIVQVVSRLPTSLLWMNRPEFATQWAILSALTAFCSSVKQSSFVRTLYGRDTFADDPEQAVFSNTFRHHHRIGTNSIVDDTDELNRGHLTSPSSSNCSKKMVKTFQAYLPNCHRTYSCVHCRAHLANHDELISKSFQGSQGRAYLFNSVVNVGCGTAEERVLLTGLHAVADIFCECCKTTLGWKYEHAYESTQKYKEGKYIIELAHMIKDNGWEEEQNEEKKRWHELKRTLSGSKLWIPFVSNSLPTCSKHSNLLSDTTLMVNNTNSVRLNIVRDNGESSSSSPSSSSSSSNSSCSSSSSSSSHNHIEHIHLPQPRQHLHQHLYFPTEASRSDQLWPVLQSMTTLVIMFVRFIEGLTDCCDLDTKMMRRCVLRRWDEIIGMFGGRIQSTLPLHHGPITGQWQYLTISSGIPNHAASLSVYLISFDPSDIALIVSFSFSLTWHTHTHTHNHWPCTMVDYDLLSISPLFNRQFP